MKKTELSDEVRKQILEEEFQKRVEAVKAKYPKVHLLTVGDKRAFLKPIDRKILSMATTVGGDDQVKLCELILDSCWIEGDEIIREDDEYFIGAMASLKELMQVKASTLVKL